MCIRDRISVGEWAAPAVSALAKRKNLRGTRLDPFGRAEVRRVERKLAAEYVGHIEAALAVLDPDNHSDVVQLAKLADRVRGYEDIKLRNVEKYRAEVASARKALGI